MPALDSAVSRIVSRILAKPWKFFQILERLEISVIVGVLRNRVGNLPEIAWHFLGSEDIGSQELSYAEVKAIASGNPAVLTLAEADAELQRLAVLKKNHLDEQYVARRSVRDLPGTIASLSERLSNLTAE